MLDIDPVWFLVQMGSFLLFLFLLNNILFKPFLNILTVREEQVKSALAAAGDANEKRDKTLASIQAELTNARHEAKDIIASAKEEGLAEQKKLLDKAQTEAASIVAKAASELQAATSAARAKLQEDVDAIASEVAHRLIRG